MASPLVDRAAPSRRDTTVAWSFVAIQSVLLAIMVFYPRDVAWVSTGLATTIGMVLMSAGVVIGLWSAVYLGRGLTPSPLPNGSTDLVMRGPYRFVRHPMYTAVMLLGIGMAIRSGSWIVTVALVGLTALFAIKARWEEMHLADTFPGYEQYMAATGRFLPRFTRWPRPPFQDDGGRIGAYDEYGDHRHTNFTSLQRVR